MAILLQEVAVDSPAMSSSPNLQEHNSVQVFFFVSMPKTIFLFYGFCSSFSQNSTLADWLRIIWLSQVVFPKGRHPFHQWFIVLPPE